MTTETTTRSNTGGFEDRFRVTRVDGQPINAERRYIVLAYDGSDPEALQALYEYAELKAEKNPQLAADIKQALVNPTAFPSQHD
jgi:hypothetical protein